MAPWEVIEKWWLFGTGDKSNTLKAVTIEEAASQDSMASRAERQTGDGTASLTLGSSVACAVQRCPFTCIPQEIVVF